MTHFATTESIEKTRIAIAAGELRIAAATDIGSIRRANQDAYSISHDEDRGELLLVVADGLGGHRGGEVASRMAVEILEKSIGDMDVAPETRLTRAVSEANQGILAAARKDRTLDGMGTTVVCLLFARDGQCFVAHVGDSRLYRFRGEHIDAMTEDHSLVGTLVREGVLSAEEARKDPRRNQILRALGVRDEVDVEVAPIQMLPGDRFLLCSDGLHGLVDDHEMRALAANHQEPDEIVKHLIDAANRNGGTDNITCLLASLPRPTIFPTIRAGAQRLLTTTRSIFRKARSE